MVVHRKLSRIPPLCQQPKRLSGKAWIDIRYSDLACQPAVSIKGVEIQAVVGRSSTLECQASGGRKKRPCLN